MSFEIKYLDLFSGIGGFRKAIELLSNDYDLHPQCLGFSEIDKYAIQSYKANYITENELDLGDIISLSKNIQAINKIPSVDLIMGGFPCQSFSIMGKQKGFSDARGNLFFNIIDIAKLKKPKYILLENVKNLLTHDKGVTFASMLESLKEIGYKNIYYDIFDSQNFKLAQKRKRLYIFATLKDMNFDFLFTEKKILENFNCSIKKCSLFLQKNILDVLSKKVDQKYYLSERIKPTILSDGSGGFRSKSEINQMIARPLTATMVKMHRACQDNYYSDDFISSAEPDITTDRVVSLKKLMQKKIRKLTPSEALNLQGFDSEFYLRCKKNGLSDHQIYKQAGNAVSVNVVYAILHYLFIKLSLR